MAEMLKLIFIAGLGIVELWAAIPAGLALNLHPISVGVASGVGSMIGALLVIVIGDRMRNWILSKKGKTQKAKGSIYKVWDKYGVVGLGLLAPLITGALFGAVIGMSLGASPKKLMIWMSIGIAVWSIILTVLGTSGIAIFSHT